LGVKLALKVPEPSWGPGLQSEQRRPMMLISKHIRHQKERYMTIGLTWVQTPLQ
jgi:hypothetical protein